MHVALCIGRLEARAVIQRVDPAFACDECSQHGEFPAGVSGVPKAALKLPTWPDFSVFRSTELNVRLSIESYPVPDKCTGDGVVSRI